MSSDFERALAYSRLPLELLDAEPELTQTRWPLYGYMTAVECSREFLRAYLKVYRDSWDQQLGQAGEGRFQAPLAEKLFANADAELTSLWKGRQAADLLGVPYSFFVASAFEFCWNYRRMPRPNQLYGDKGALDHVMERSQRLNILQQLDEVFDGRFLVRNYRNDPPQNALHDLLCSHLAQMHAKEQMHALNELVVLRELLPLDRVRAHLGEEICAQLPSVVIGPPDIDFESHRPSCYGMLGAFDEASKVCRSCPHISGCLTEVDYTLDLTIANWGSCDPRETREKAMEAQRKREKRAAAKAAGSAGR